MKFKELLQKMPFDDIVPELSRYFRSIGYKSKDIRSFIPGCKKAYDILMQLEPEETDRQVRFYLDRYYAERYGDDPTVEMDLYDDNFETCPWSINLGKEIVLDEGVELSDAEIAARCLFHITFYGFTPKQVKGRLARIEWSAEQAMKKDPSKLKKFDLDKWFDED